MRPDDNMRRIIAARNRTFLGAQAASLLFAAACRELRARLRPRPPNPWILLRCLNNTRVPWVAHDVLKLLFEITIRSHQSIKRFRFPYRLPHLVAFFFS